MQVENLGLLATPFGQGLRALALTCNDLCSLSSRSNLQASQSKFFTVWPPNPSKHKLSDIHLVQLASIIATTCQSIWPGLKSY